MSTLEQLEAPAFADIQRTGKKHSNTVDYFGIDIGPYNHPAAIANIMLNVVQHKKVFGLQAVGGMGEGKSQFVTTVVHHIHREHPEYLILWKGAYEFQHMDEFLNSLPKYTPLIIIFDDISGVLKEMSDKELNHNFQALTRIRWIIDPEKGLTPSLLFTTSHYTRTTEKSYRAVLGLIALMSFGSEEATNIDLLAAKDTWARTELTRFKKMADTMFTQHEFLLKVGPRKVLCKTDEPLRASCVLAGTNGYITVFAKDDCCALCSKKQTTRFVPAKEIVSIIHGAWGKVGIQALKLAMHKRGKHLALGKQLAPALDFVEGKIFANMTTDYDDLIKELFVFAKKKPVERIYHKRKLEKETLDKLYKESIVLELEDELGQTEVKE